MSYPHAQNGRANPHNGGGHGKYLRFRANQLEEIALESPAGLSAQKLGFADQVVFTLVDGRKMYVPLIVADMIDQHGIRPGERIRVGKMEVKTGPRREIRWKVERIGREIEPETELERSLRESVENIVAQKAGDMHARDEMQSALNSLR